MMTKLPCPHCDSTITLEGQKSEVRGLTSRIEKKRQKESAAKLAAQIAAGGVSTTSGIVFTTFGNSLFFQDVQHGYDVCAECGTVYIASAKDDSNKNKATIQKLKQELYSPLEKLALAADPEEDNAENIVPNVQ